MHFFCTLENLLLLMRLVTAHGCGRTGLSKRTMRRHMQREFGDARPGRRHRNVSHDIDDPGPHESDSDSVMDLFDEAGGGADAVPDAEQWAWLVDERVADASIPCSAQRALDRAEHDRHKRDRPVVQGGHLCAKGVLVISAILSIRFSFTQMATTAVLQFVGAVLPAPNIAPCGAICSASS